jgi:hypothetical protein
MAAVRGESFSLDTGIGTLGQLVGRELRYDGWVLS